MYDLISNFGAVPHRITRPGLWHGIKHLMIILHSHITRGLTDNRFLKLSPDVLTVIPTRKDQTYHTFSSHYGNKLYVKC